MAGPDGSHSWESRVVTAQRYSYHGMWECALSSPPPSPPPHTAPLLSSFPFFALSLPFPLSLSPAPGSASLCVLIYLSSRVSSRWPLVLQAGMTPGWPSWHPYTNPRERLFGRAWLASHQTCFFLLLGSQLDGIPASPASGVATWMSLANGMWADVKVSSSSLAHRNLPKVIFFFSFSLCWLNRADSEAQKENGATRWKELGSLNDSMEGHIGLRVNYKCTSIW